MTASGTTPTTRDRPVGGFFGLELPAGTGGLAAFWGFGPGDPGWSNATSALAALVALTRGAVWFPAFLCTGPLLAVPPERRRFYPLGPDLAPDIAALRSPSGPVAGDIVLAVNYFGRAPGPDWRDFVATLPDLLFVEDCAQSVDTGEGPWGDWRLYSPRKLVGVPEGGFLVACTQKAALFRPEPPADPDFAAAVAVLAPALARFEMPEDNAFWHPLNQEREAAHAVSSRPMARLSRALLSLAEPAPLIARRQDNFRILGQALAAFAVLPEPDPAFIPFGFPVRLPPARRDAVARALHAARIFAAVHWRNLPVPRSFAREWEMADSFITLPCDQRWTTREMERIAAVFLAAVAGEP